MRAADGSDDRAKKFVARLTGRVRVERQRNIASRERWRPRHRAPQWLTETEPLVALGRAWLVAMIAIGLFCSALGLARIWDRTIFFEALHEALTSNPELQSPEEVPVDTPDEHEVSAAHGVRN